MYNEALLSLFWAPDFVFPGAEKICWGARIDSEAVLENGRLTVGANGSRRNGVFFGCSAEGLCFFWDFEIVRVFIRTQVNYIESRTNFLRQNGYLRVRNHLVVKS